MEPYRLGVITDDNVKYSSTLRFPIDPKKVKKSPLKTVDRVRRTLKAFKAKKQIGFTARSSLKSMGLIPRSNGLYVLGEKYKRRV